MGGGADAPLDVRGGVSEKKTPIVCDDRGLKAKSKFQYLQYSAPPSKSQPFRAASDAHLRLVVSRDTAARLGGGRRPAASVAGHPSPREGVMSARTMAEALDFARFEAIEQYADLAASYWRSVAEAASRGEGLTVEVHCKQIAAVTRAAFSTVKELGSGEKAFAA